MIISGYIGCLVTTPLVSRWRKFKLASLLINLLSAAGTLLFAFTLPVGNVYLTCFSAAVVGFGMLPISAFMLELACEVTYPVGEAMSTGMLNLGGQVVGIAGAFAVTYILNISHLLGNLVITVCMFTAAIVTMIIRENFLRSAKDKEAQEGLLLSDPATLFDPPSPTTVEADFPEGNDQTEETSINRIKE